VGVRDRANGGFHKIMETETTPDGQLKDHRGVIPQINGGPPKTCAQCVLPFPGINTPSACQVQ